MPGGRSTWVGSPVTIILLSSPSRVRNILICTGVQFCASSRMINGMRERAPAHEGERRDLDHAGGEAALDPLRRQHVVECVVERPEIGIDLLAHVAGQKAEPLAGLDRRPRQDQPVASAALQAGRGEGDREIGLAGAGGAGGEHEIVLLQRGEIGALHRRARGDQPLARADLLRLGHAGARLVIRVRLEGARMADGADHFADADHLALRQPAVKLLEHGFGGGAGGFRPAQADRIAVDHGLDPEPVLEHGEIGVIVAEQIAHEPDVVEIHDGRLAAAIGLRGVRSASAPHPARAPMMISECWPCWSHGRLNWLAPFKPRFYDTGETVRARRPRCQPRRSGRSAPPVPPHAPPVDKVNARRSDLVSARCPSNSTSSRRPTVARSNAWRSLSIRLCKA